MTTRDRKWLHGFLRLDRRQDVDGIPDADIRRQEDTVLRALERLDQQPGVVIADEVGMGKTWEALGVAAAFHQANGDARILVLTPGPDLNTKWVQEFQTWRDPERTVYDFQDGVASADDLPSFLAKARTARVVVAPVSMFAGTRGAREKAYLLSLFGHWAGLHRNTVDAMVRRVDQRVDRVDPTHDAVRFLGVVGYPELEPLLPEVFAAKSDGVPGLADLWHQHGLDLFDQRDVDALLDDVRFRLVRALLPSFSLVILDEAHKLKNAHTVRAHGVAGCLRDRFDKALFLTATPFQLDVHELRQVFQLFSLAKGAPTDLLARADGLFASIRDYQAAYGAFEAAWRRLDAAAVGEFTAWHQRDPAFASPSDDPSLRVVAERYRALHALKDQHIEPGFRQWMIRSVREEKRAYRRSVVERLPPAGGSALPFLLYERFIAEIFRRGVRTHKASVEINMVSSFAAARTGALLAAGEVRGAPPEVERYRALLGAVLGEERGKEPEHPKIDHVVRDALEAAGRNEKTLIFCARIETLRHLRKTLDREWIEGHLLSRWGKVLPGAAYETVFDTTEGAEKRIGFHTRLRQRFQRGQDSLYLALREGYTQLLAVPHDFLRDHLEEIVERANEKVPTLRTVPSRAASLDWQLAKRVLEQATVEVWRALAPEDAEEQREWVERVADPRFLTLGFDLARDDLEKDDAGDSVPQWKLSVDVAEVVLIRSPGLWAFMKGDLEMFAPALRVQVVERIARYLLYREVPFLVELLTAWKRAGHDPEVIESRVLLAFVDRFWGTEDGRRWVARVQEFVRYLHSRPLQQRAEILEGPIQQGAFVRSTEDGDSRERLREAFNTPLYPMILLANEVMQEGLDLHRHCRRVVHHDLAWNPAQLEQRVGRVDRLGSLTLRLRVKRPDTTLDVLHPLVLRTIDERLYRTVKAREKWLDFLLGQPPRFEDYGLDDLQAAPLPAAISESLRIDLRPRD